MESIKSIQGVTLDGMDILYGQSRFILGRANVGIHDLDKTLGTELFVDTILGYQIGHYDGRHPERLEVSLDFIKFLITGGINHSDLINRDFHQSELGVLYMVRASNGQDMLPVKIYKSIDHKYDDLIEERGGNLKKLRRIKTTVGMLKGLGISI